MSQVPRLAINVQHPEYRNRGETLANALNLPLIDNPELAEFCLLINDLGLSIQARDTALGSPLRVDFCQGGVDHRRRFGGGRGQDIAKAVGLNKTSQVTILDATAGLGRDAFVLASLGCRITMFERDPVVYQLLKDGLERAAIGPEEVQAVVSRMKLYSGEARTHSVEPHQVIFLDPMFPESKKSAKVKKEMQILHQLVGKDENADELLPWALTAATHRVVVKRPRLAPPLNGQTPTLTFEGKSGRFDVYVIRGFA